jgi:hypothetical protein
MESLLKSSLAPINITLQNLDIRLKNVEANQLKLGGNQINLEANQTKLEANQTKLDVNQTKLEANQTKLEANQIMLESRIERSSLNYNKLFDRMFRQLGSIAESGVRIAVAKKLGEPYVQPLNATCFEELIRPFYGQASIPSNPLVFHINNAVRKIESKLCKNVRFNIGYFRPSSNFFYVLK